MKINNIRLRVIKLRSVRFVWGGLQKLFSASEIIILNYLGRKKYLCKTWSDLFIFLHGQEKTPRESRFFWFRKHYSDPDQLLEFRKPTYVDPSPNIKVNSHIVPPTQNPLIREQRAHDLAIGRKAARAGKLKPKPKANIFSLYMIKVHAVDNGLIFMTYFFSLSPQ